MARYRKLIEPLQETAVVCDNKYCDFEIKNKTQEPNINISIYINEPCPKCGENLLTQSDYDKFCMMIKFINFINKWFSWISVFIKEEDGEVIGVHVHNDEMTISKR